MSKLLIFGSCMDLALLRSLTWKPVDKRKLPVFRALLCCFLLLSINSISWSQEHRAIDGAGNHPLNLGSTGAPILRITDVDYSDGISTPAALLRTNAREISNNIFSQATRIDNKMSLSDYTWAFGQFIDHDISLVGNHDSEVEVITIPVDDQFFSPNEEILMSRSDYINGSGTDINNPREYSNEVTSFLDASMIYGSTEARASWLRDDNSEIGKLKTSNGNFLPWNTISGEIDGSTSDPQIPYMDASFTGNKHFVAGDIRANENPLLVALHTLFVREHNRICDELAEIHPGWSGEKIYQYARKHIGAYIQAITYYEWLPSMGINLPEYSGYRSTVDPSIYNVFSAAAFRIGHTLINSSIIRMGEDGEELQMGNISLRDAFFNPTIINIAGGIEPYLKGMGTNLQQELDCKMIDDLRNFLFGAPGQGGLDLAAINIQRGRERGLPDYNTVRANFGLPKISSFESITGESGSAQLLENVYGDIDNIDSWVGMLSEQHVKGALFGELVMTILKQQFQDLRDGDRFYFENEDAFTEEEITAIKNTSLQDIIMRNTSIDLMQDNVFLAMPHNDIPNGPSLVPLQLEAALYPNPTSEFVHVKFYLEIPEDVDLTIYDANGSMISTVSYTGVQGENFMTLPLPTEISRGMINIKLESERAYRILRVLKK